MEINTIQKEKFQMFIIQPILNIRHENQYQGQSFPRLDFRIKNKGEIKWNKQ